jgi:signal transduction histidine kinase
MLWDKAISAEERIREIEEGIEPEITEIVTGWDNIFKRNIDNLSNEKHRVNSCCDALILSKIVKSPMYKASADYVNRGGNIRMITEITAKNLSSVKELMKIQEIRHIDQFSINFGVSETVFAAPTYVYSMSSNPQCIYSNSKDLIKQHLYLFDTLWEKAVPAEERIREIEQNIEHETIDTLRDHNEIQKIAQDLVKLAKEQILIIFSTANAFHRQEKAGTIELLLNAAKALGVQTRTLVPFDGSIVEAVKRLEGRSQKKIMTRSIEANMQTRISILIVDQRYALTAELKDDTKETSIEAMGLATYSNSKATVSSYAAIFESLWHQAEMYNLLRVHNERQLEFINIAAHELRTPIQPILGLSGILFEKSDAHDREHHQQLLEVIHRNANRLYRMTENLLDVTRIETQHLQLNRERCNLGDLIREVVTNTETSTGFKNVKLLFSPLMKEDKVVDFPVNVDRERIIQVLGNLLSNAAKFTKVGGIIALTLQDGIGGHSHDSNNDNDDNSTRFAVVSVRDNGPGIDPEMVPRLFEKFASKSEKGTGLGLFISKGIIEAHGGRIWANNNEKDRTGATFSFSLPLANEDLDH